MKWDVFISHSSEDKEQLARPLAHELEGRGLRVWYDEFTLRAGDPLRRSIDNGLVHSRMGVLVLSESFFKKEWPQREVDGLVALKRHLIPVWHKIEQHQVANYSPTLADLIALDSKVGIPALADQIHSAILKLDQEVPAIHAPTIVIGERGLVVHDDDELKLIVDEILDRVNAGIKPAFDIDFTPDCLSALCADELRNHEEIPPLLGLRAMKDELASIRRKSKPSRADRKTALIFSALLREAAYYRTLLLESIAFVVNRCCPYVNDASTMASCIRGIAERVLSRTTFRLGGDGLGVVLYRRREPELHTTIWLTSDEAADLGRSLGHPPEVVLTLGLGYLAGELPLEVLVRKGIPAIIVEIFQRRGKVATYEPKREYADLGHWSLGLH